MVKNDFDVQQFKDVAKEALSVSGAYIHSVILSSICVSEYDVKDDKTLVTKVDKESQKIACPIILKNLPDYKLKQEESEEYLGNLNSDIVIYHDPLDGTRGFVLGGLAQTVILGAYDSAQKIVLAAATMEPISGRFWFSARGEGTEQSIFDYSRGTGWGTLNRKLKVNDYKLSDRGCIFTETNSPYKDNMTLAGRLKLSEEIQKAGGKESSLLGNGIHYALVASGRPTLIGVITTARGGPQDLSGILHVKESGGVVQCYNIKEKALYPLGEDIESARVAIGANNTNTLNKLEKALSLAVSY